MKVQLWRSIVYVKWNYPYTCMPHRFFLHFIDRMDFQIVNYTNWNEKSQYLYEERSGSSNSNRTSTSQQTEFLVMLFPFNAAMCDLLAFKFWCEKKNEHLNHSENYPHGIHTSNVHVQCILCGRHQSGGYYYNLYVHVIVCIALAA